MFGCLVFGMDPSVEFAYETIEHKITICHYIVECASIMKVHRCNSLVSGVRLEKHGLWPGYVK